MTKGRTGSDYGRSGGRASGASRARSALAKAPRVKVVGAIAKNQKKSAPALGTMSYAQAKAASNAVLLMGEQLGLSPGSISTVSRVAVAAVSAAVAVPAPSPSIGSRIW